MTTLRQDLSTRRDEFDEHYQLAKALEDRMILDAGVGIGSIYLSSRHINTLKSGLVVHLYNILEAMMSKALESLGDALGTTDPRRWAEPAMREWLRESVVGRLGEGSEEGKLATVYKSSSQLLGGAPLGSQKLKKPSGSWDDKLVASFMRRMSIQANMPPSIWSSIAKAAKYGNRTPIQFVADRRNAIAHGRRSFEDGASDLLLADIRVLADITLDYLGYTMDSISKHISEGAYLAPT